MKITWWVLLLFSAATSAVTQAGAESVAGITLYPGSSANGVEGPEKVIKDTGYPIALCQRSNHSLEKGVALHRRDKALELLRDPTKDNATFAHRSGSPSISINRPWFDASSMGFKNETLIRIAARAAK